MSDSKKPTVSEMRRLQAIYKARDRGYLLDLVKRMGDTLKLLYAWLDNQPDGRGQIESKIVKEARALLEEIKK